MRRIPIFLGVSVTATAIVACAAITGLSDYELVDRPDVAVIPVDVDTGVDAGVASDSAIPAADGACVRSGGFCDECDPELVLSVRFDGTIVDRSRFAHTIDVDGATTYVNTPLGTAISLDGSVDITAQALDVDVTTGLTVEVVARQNQAPEAGARSGLIDRDGDFGLFLHDDGSLTCAMAATDAGVATSSMTHYSCVIGHGTAQIYVDGVPRLDVDASEPVPSMQAIAIGRNSPFGDPFIGEIVSVCIYRRPKTQAEVLTAAGLDGSSNAP